MNLVLGVIILLSLFLSEWQAIKSGSALTRWSGIAFLLLSELMWIYINSAKHPFRPIPWIMEWLNG